MKKISTVIDGFINHLDVDKLNSDLEGIVITDEDSKDILSSLSAILSSISTDDITKIIAILGGLITLASKLKVLFSKSKDLGSTRAMSAEDTIALTNGLLTLALKLTSTLSSVAAQAGDTEAYIAQIKASMDTYFPEWQKTW